MQPSAQAIITSVMRSLAAKSARSGFKAGFAEELPVEDEWADVLISNGVFNLVPGKITALSEMYRVLKPGGRLQIGDILVDKPVPEEAKENIELWTG